MRVTISNLDHKAHSLTTALRRINMLSETAKIVRESAYGGHRLVVTGGPSLPNGSISSGQFGLETAYQRTGLAYANAHAVLEFAIEINYRTTPPRY